MSRRAELAKLRTMALALAALADGLLAEGEAEAPAPDVWVTIAASGLPPKAARRLLHTGELEGRRVGRSWYVSRASVAAYMRAEAPKPSTGDPLAAELGLTIRRTA